ncbi:thioredoxin domain-containing protein [Martensiomyces pterosporus]|nr:thioredoxin domain-containing protein [Martensiomyces pterosporus]
MAVIEITSEQQFDELIKTNAKVAVDFTATWCGPCKLISPIFKALSEQYSDVVFASVDVDSVSPVAQKCGIRAMPTFHFFKDGQKSDELTGANKVGLEAKVKALAA